MTNKEQLISNNNSLDVLATKISEATEQLANMTFNETDPTVPDWAKAATKPTYTAAEVGALPSTTTIPNVGSGTDYTTYRARSIALKTTAETPANGCLLGVYS